VTINNLIKGERKTPRISPEVIIIVVVFFAVGMYVQGLEPGLARRITAESGPFEIASAAMYGTAFLLGGWQLFREQTILRLSGVVMVLWATLRELDFQKRFTYRSVESIGYYSRPTAPLSQKLVVLLILLPFALAGAFLVWTYWKQLPSAWRSREKWVGYTFGIVVLMLASSFMEKILRFESVEEVCETGVALIVLLLVWETRSRAGSATEVRPVPEKVQAE
jgi:hypothetical protein